MPEVHLIDPFQIRRDASSKHQNNDGAQCDHFFFTDLQMLTEAKAGIPSPPRVYGYYTVKILAPLLMQVMGPDTYCLYPGKKYFGYINYKFTSG